jgi:hypothetical protein
MVSTYACGACPVLCSGVATAGSTNRSPWEKFMPSPAPEATMVSALTHGRKGGGVREVRLWACSSGGRCVLVGWDDLRKK